MLALPEKSWYKILENRFLFRNFGKHCVLGDQNTKVLLSCGESSFVPDNMGLAGLSILRKNELVGRFPRLIGVWVGWECTLIADINNLSYISL